MTTPEKSGGTTNEIGDCCTETLLFSARGFFLTVAFNAQWAGYAHNRSTPPVSGVAGAESESGPLAERCVNTNSPSGEIFIHYGSLSITSGRTQVLVPVKTLAQDGITTNFEVLPFNGETGASLGYTLTSDYTLPPQFGATYNSYDWTPSYGPASASTRVSIIRARAAPSTTAITLGGSGIKRSAGRDRTVRVLRESVYTANQAALNAAIQISTPITADRYGDIFFGFIASRPNIAGVVSGLARIGPTGVGTWVSATSLAGGDSQVAQVRRPARPRSATIKDRLCGRFGRRNFDTNGYLGIDERHHPCTVLSRGALRSPRSPRHGVGRQFRFAHGPPRRRRLLRHS